MKVVLTCFPKGKIEPLIGDGWKCPNCDNALRPPKNKYDSFVSCPKCHEVSDFRYIPEEATSPVQP